MVNALSFLTFLQQGGNVVEPFTRVMIGGGKKKSSSRTKKKTKSKTIKRKKNLSRKKATRRKNRSNKKSLKKRTMMTKKNQRTNRKKRQCNCDAKKFYTGKEPSPKGLGFCAHCSPENITMKGLDGELWKNQKYSKGKRWMRV
jgi:hypothetical protein